MQPYFVNSYVSQSPQSKDILVYIKNGKSYKLIFLLFNSMGVGGSKFIRCLLIDGKTAFFKQKHFKLCLYNFKILPKNVLMVVEFK